MKQQFNPGPLSSVQRRGGERRRRYRDRSTGGEDPIEGAVRACPAAKHGRALGRFGVFGV